MTQETQMSSSDGHQTPAVRRGGLRPWLAVLLVLMLAGIAFWLWFERVPERKEVAEQMAEEVTQKVEQLIVGDRKAAEGEDTAPVEAGQTHGNSVIGSLVPERVPPSSAETPDSTRGVSTGQAAGEPAAGEIAAAGNDADVRTEGEGAGRTPGGTTPGMQPRADVQTARGLVVHDPRQTPPRDTVERDDDLVVRWAFLDDLAHWMVAGYTPGSQNGRGRIDIGIQSANTRYGTGMKGLAWIGGDLPSGRFDALKYVYSDGMLEALYRLYIDRFMQAMEIESREALKNDRPLEPFQIAEMYRLYAGKMLMLSGTLQGLADIGNLHERMQQIRSANKRMLAANEWYEERCFAYGNARDNGASEEKLATARHGMETASQAYRRTMQEHDELCNALVADISRRANAWGLGSDNMLYVAAWVDRRLQQSQGALLATRKAADLFGDLSGRFLEASKQVH